MDSNNRAQKDIDWTRGAFPTWAKMLIAVAVVLLMMLVLFRVSTFEVSGNVRYSLEEIADASGLTEGDILMGVNKTSTASRLLVQLPYLEEVVIYKELPGTVRFEVKECTAVGIAESEFGTYWTLNRESKLLEEVEEPDEDGESAYPVIKGVQVSLPTAGDDALFADEYRGELVMALLAAVDDVDLHGEIREVNVEDDQDVYVVYDGRIEVHLGDGNQAEYKLQYLLAVLPKLAEDASGLLDLSFSVGEQAVFHPIV